MPRHFLALPDHSPAEIRALLDLAHRIKARPADWSRVCAGRSLAMVFQKPSLRTRVSFQSGMFQLGGQATFLGPKELQLHRGESVADTARVLSRYVDGIMCRLFAHNDLLEFARYATVPVINGLTDWNHPCQVLADLMTIEEKRGDLAGRRLAYVGDGNNMAHSLLFGGALVGMHVAVAHPEGYAPDPGVVARARQIAAGTGGSVSVGSDPAAAVDGADAVYTDVWASMGQEAEREARLRDFAGYGVTAALMARAAPDALFLHCLPAHRGEEVDAAVIDGPQSVVFDEAENRLHAQKAILVTLLGDPAAAPR